MKDHFRVWGKRQDLSDLPGGKGRTQSPSPLFQLDTETEACEVDPTMRQYIPGSPRPPQPRLRKSPDQPDSISAQTLPSLSILPLITTSSRWTLYRDARQGTYSQLQRGLVPYLDLPKGTYLFSPLWDFCFISNFRNISYMNIKNVHTHYLHSYTLCHPHMHSHLFTCPLGHTHEHTHTDAPVRLYTHSRGSLPELTWEQENTPF